MMVLKIKSKIVLTCIFLVTLSGLAKAQTQDIPAQNVQVQNANVQDFQAVNKTKELDYVLEAYVKIKSIKKTSQDVLQVYREIGATPQQVAVPYVFLSFLGYPNYFAVTQDHNVCVFIYFSPTEGNRKYIILAKLIEGSNLKKIVENIGGSIEENEGWTFFAKNKEDFALVKDKKWMLTYANGHPKSDIEFGIQPSIISLTKLSADRGLNEALKNLNETIGSININDTQILLDGILNYKNQGPELGDWLVKNTMQTALTIKNIPKGKNESEIHIALERKNLCNFINQLRAKVSSLETK